MRVIGWDPKLAAQGGKMTIEQSDSLKAEREMVKALKARKEALEEALAKKTEELKRLCFDEGQLTGVLPNDTPALAPGEQVPTFRRRVGTAFSLSLKDDKDNDTQTSIDLSKLELEVELQGKITSAAHRLASDKTVSKYVRKQRRQSYTRAAGKLKEMEKKLGDMRRQLGKPDDHHHHHHHHHHHTTSRLTDGMYHVMNDDDHSPSPTKSPIDLTTSTTHPSAIALSQDQSGGKDTDSCGNSVYSGDCSLASSADVEDGEGSVNYILHTCRSSSQMRLNKGVLRRMSSRGSSLSASSDLSYSISDVSERLDMLMDVSMIHGDSDKHLNSDDETDTEDYSISEAERNRSRNSHFKYSRREDRPRGDDRRKDFNRVRMLAKLEEDVSSENDSCASSEYEREDSLRDESVVRGFRQREGSASTLVERRRKTLITSKRTVSCRETLGRSSISEGYKVFEKHCLEDWIENLKFHSTDDLEDSPIINQRDRGRRFCRRERRSDDESQVDQESSHSRKTSCTDSELDRSHSSIKLTPPLAFSPMPKIRNNSHTEGKQVSRRPSNDSEGSELSRTPSQGSRGRPLLTLTSCTRRPSQRSPSPDQSRLSSVSNTTHLVPDNLKPGAVKGRPRHIIYARSKTPDLRRTKSNLSTPLSSAPLVLQEDLEEFSPVFEEDNVKDKKFNYCSNTISFPIRRGLSCPTINRGLSSSSGVETIV